MVNHWYFLIVQKLNPKGHSASTYLEAEARWGSAGATTNTGADTDNVSVNGAGDAVVDLDVELGESVLYKNQKEQCVQIEKSQSLCAMNNLCCFALPAVHSVEQPKSKGSAILT